VGFGGPPALRFNASSRAASISSMFMEPPSGKVLLHLLHDIAALHPRIFALHKTFATR
jgi:hypothetical protein